MERKGHRTNMLSPKWLYQFKLPPTMFFSYQYFRLSVFLFLAVLLSCVVASLLWFLFAFFSILIGHLGRIFYKSCQLIKKSYIPVSLFHQHNENLYLNDLKSLPYLKSKLSSECQIIFNIY